MTLGFQDSLLGWLLLTPNTSPHCVHILSTLCVHFVYIVCTICLHCVYILYSLCVHFVYIVCTWCASEVVHPSCSSLHSWDQGARPPIHRHIVCHQIMAGKSSLEQEFSQGWKSSGQVVQVWAPKTQETFQFEAKIKECRFCLKNNCPRALLP